MNFANHELGTSITTSQPASDGFEEQNLLNAQDSENTENDENPVVPPEVIFTYKPRADPWKLGQGKGFMVDYFIRPPVTIKLEFPCAIDISHIVMCPKVGRQTSTAFVFQTTILERGNKKQSESGIANRNEHSPSPARQGTTVVIGKEFINTDPVPDILVFKNPRFVLHRRYQALVQKGFEVHQNNPDAFALKHPFFNACEDVLSLEITILRVLRSTAPSIGSLQIWGQPSTQCSKSEVTSLFSRLKSAHKASKRKRHRPADNEYKTDEPSRKFQKPEVDSDTEIPDDFLDQITLEIMCQPMRLPNGLAVDLRTVEKCAEGEARYGRLPRDPFTGRCYTASEKPIPDPRLKLRIDTFLSKHAHVKEFSKLPRTLGHGPRPPLATRRVPSASATRPSQPETDENENAPEVTGTGSTNLIPTQTASETRVSTDNSNTLTLNTLGSTDRTSLELARIFKDGTSYLKLPSSKNSSPPKEDCTRCLHCNVPYPHHLSKHLPYYQSSCGHVYLCRQCLITACRPPKNQEEKIYNCAQCGLEWTPKDLTKAYLSGSPS